jgi:hypothetical protein
LRYLREKERLDPASKVESKGEVEEQSGATRSKGKRDPVGHRSRNKRSTCFKEGLPCGRRSMDMIRI